MRNLLAEMTRYGVTFMDLSKTMECTEKTVRNKVNGQTEFSVGEAMRVRDTHFPGLTLEYLFSGADQTDRFSQQSA